MRARPRWTVMLALCAAIAACGLFPDSSGLAGAGGRDVYVARRP